MIRLPGLGGLGPLGLPLPTPLSLIHQTLKAISEHIAPSWISGLELEHVETSTDIPKLHIILHNGVSCSISDPNIIN